MCILHINAITTLFNKVTLTLDLQGNIHCYISHRYYYAILNQLM